MLGSEHVDFQRTDHIGPESRGLTPINADLDNELGLVLSVFIRNHRGLGGFASPPPRGLAPFDRAGKRQRQFSCWDRSTLISNVRITSDLRADRKSTRLNSSHLVISYAVFC